MRTTGAAALLPALLAIWGCGNSKVRNEYAAAAKLLPGQIAAAKAEGVPLDPSDLERNLPAAENAADGYRRAITMMVEPKTSGIGPNPTPEEIDDSREEISKNTVALAKAAIATSIPHLYFKRDYGLGAKVMFPELAKLKGLARLFCKPSQAGSENRGLRSRCSRRHTR